MALGNRPPKPAAPAADTAEAEFQEELDARIGAVRKLGKVPTRSAATAGKNPFGKELPLFVCAAVSAMSGARTSYAGLSFSPSSLKEDLARWLIAGSVKAKVEDLAADASSSHQQQGAALADKVLAVLQTTETTLANPATPESVKTATATAASELTSLKGQRNTQKRAARAATLAQKAASKSATSESSRLKLENRYLAGEQLDPEDLQPQAAPARGRRRTPRGA